MIYLYATWSWLKARTKKEIFVFLVVLAIVAAWLFGGD